MPANNKLMTADPNPIGDPAATSGWAKVLDETEQLRACWLPEELGSILRHQLSAPVQFHASDEPTRPPPNPDQQSSPSPVPIRTFDELFHHPHPPIELLRRTHQFAKINLSRSGSLLLPEIATLLYYAAIILAQVRWNERITRLDAAALEQGRRWILDQPWVDERTKGIFR
jgi:hypothetical protein